MPRRPKGSGAKNFMSTDLNLNENKLVEAVALLIDHIKQLLSRLQKCSSKESIRDCIYEGELKESLVELSTILSHTEGLETLCECFVNWQIVTSVVTPLLFYATIIEELEIQSCLLQILLRLVEIPQSLGNTNQSKDRLASYFTTLEKAFIEPVFTTVSGKTVTESKALPKNLNLLWFVGKILVENLSLVLLEGWSGVSKSIIGVILSLIERLTCQGKDSKTFYSTKHCRSPIKEETVSWLVSLKIYDAVFVFLSAESVRDNIPNTILCLMIGVIAGPCYFVIQCFGPVFMSANVADRGESSQNNENKPHISSSAKVDNSKRSERIMRWSSQHNSMIPILKFYKDGERKYGHWEEKKERNIVSICDGVLKHATASYRLEVSRDNGLVESFSSICQEAPYGLPNEVLLCIEELFDSCIAFIHKWLLNGYTSILSNDCPYVKKLPIYRFPSIVSSYIRIVYAAAFSSGSMIEHLAYFLDERCLHFLVRTFSRFVEWEDYEMERAFLTALADYLWMLFVLVSRNEGLMPENFSSRQRIFECNKYPQWKFQAKQLIEVFFEKEELHSPVIAYFKSFKARKGHSRPFLDLCVQLLSTLIGLHQVLEQVSGGNLSVERTKRKRRKQANNDEELSAVRNMESHAKKVVHRPSDLLMTPLIRSQTFELLLLPFHNILSNHFVSEAKNVAIHKSLSILCRLCYMALKRLWKIACSRKLRPQLYSATFIAFFYALTLPEAELRFSIVFKDHGEFLSGLRSLSKDISDSFVETFRQNIVVAVDALFPMNSATCSYYENMTRREETESTSRTRKKHRKALRRSNLESLRTEESSPSMRVSRTEIDNINYLVEGSNDQLSSQNCVRRRIRVINDNDDD